MILDSLLLAAITGTGMYFIFRALPLKVRLFLHNHMLATRLACAILTYTLLGGSLTALFAAAWLDLFVSILMELYRNPESAEAMGRLSAMVSEFRSKVTGWICNSVRSITPPPAQQYVPEHRKVCEPLATEAIPC
jgi:hypothetical protein